MRADLRCLRPDVAVWRTCRLAARTRRLRARPALATSPGPRCCCSVYVFVYVVIQLSETYASPSARQAAPTAGGGMPASLGPRVALVQGAAAPQVKPLQRGK